MSQPDIDRLDDSQETSAPGMLGPSAALCFRNVPPVADRRPANMTSHDVTEPW